VARLARRLLSVGKFIFVRTAALISAFRLAVAEDWGVRGVWAALAALILVRAATMGARFTRRRWLVTGWA
jgi:Na+-driven multidrug efflux pump